MTTDRASLQYGGAASRTVSVRAAIRRGLILVFVVVCSLSPAPSLLHSMDVAVRTGESSEQRKSDPPLADRLTEQEKTCIGAYISEVKTVFHVEADGKQLCTTIDGKRFCLIRQKDGNFKVELKFLGFIPISADHLEDISISFSDLEGKKVVILHRGQEEMVLGKMVTPPALTKAWLSRTGSYKFVNAGDKKADFEKISLSCRNSLLTLNYSVKTIKEPAKSVALKPTSDTEADILDPDGNPGETIRIVNAEGIERLQFAGYELVRADAVAFPETP